jgi:hypothetical protein
MFVVRLEITSIVMCGISYFLYVLAKARGNFADQAKLKWCSLLFAATSFGLAFPLGALHLQDSFLPVGLAFWAAAAMMRRDRETVIVLCGLSAGVFALWVFYYDMNAWQYRYGYGMAVLDPVLYALILLGMYRINTRQTPETQASYQPA